MGPISVIKEHFTCDTRLGSCARWLPICISFVIWYRHRHITCNILCKCDGSIILAKRSWTGGGRWTAGTTNLIRCIPVVRSTNLSRKIDLTHGMSLHRITFTDSLLKTAPKFDHHHGFTPHMESVAKIWRMYVRMLRKTSSRPNRPAAVIGGGIFGDLISAILLLVRSHARSARRPAVLKLDWIVTQEYINNTLLSHQTKLNADFKYCQ